jgi:zinc protease
MVNKGQAFDAQRGAAAAMYGTYFGQGLSSIVFQEIRESRSLAYSAASIYSQNPRAGKPDYLFNYIGTQADKIPLAVKALNELLADIPYAKEQFEAARTAELKKIEAERITKAQVFWTYERLKKRGINHDIRKDTYERLKSFEFEDLQAFFETNVKNNLFDIAIIGNRKDVNFKELSKMGELKELDVDYLFNF